MVQAESQQDYFINRVKFLTNVSSATFIKPGYSDWYYPFPYVANQTEIEEVNKIAELTYKAINNIIVTYHNDKSLQRILPLKEKTKRQLEEIRDIPLDLGLIRIDYLIDENNKPMICEVGTRFIFNGLIQSYLINKDVKKIFNRDPIKELDKLEKMINTLGRAAILKEREIGWDILYLLVEKKIPVWKTNQENDFDTWILELHQDELENKLSKVINFMKDNGRVLNDPRSVFLAHNKRLLAILSREKILKRYLSEDEAVFLSQHVIPSYLSDIQPFIFNKAKMFKEHYILKVGISGKCNGIYIGKDTEGKLWQELLSRKDVVIQPYLKQKKFVFQDPYKESYNAFLAGTCGVYQGESFGPSVMRIFTEDIKNKGFVQVVQ